MTSKQAQVAGSFPNLSLRRYIGQFDVGLEGITARAVAFKLHLFHLRGSLALLRNADADSRAGADRVRYAY